MGCICVYFREAVISEVEEPASMSVCGIWLLLCAERKLFYRGAYDLCGTSGDERVNF